MFGHRHFHGRSRCHRPMGPSHHHVIIKPVIPIAPPIQPPIYVSIQPHIALPVQPPVHYDPPPAYDYRERRYQTVSPPPPAYDNQGTYKTVSPPPPAYDNQVYDWVPSGTYSQVPPKAVEVGTDGDGSKIYVGKAKYLNDELPCKVIPGRRQAYVSYDGKEREVSNYEVMVEKKLTWMSCGHGSVPPGAVVGGHTSSGETLYIGRVRHGGSLCLGKVQPSHGCLYIPYGGQEISYRDYEVLVAA